MSAETRTAEKKGAGLRDLLKIRDYRFLWLGQIVSDFGDSLTVLALLFTINEITGSAAAVATMLIALTIPQITFGLVAGVYVDRLDRKRIMIASDLLRGVLVLGFIVAASVEMVWLIYLIGFLQAAVGTFFTPARGAMIPNIVPREALLAANSVAQTSRILFGLLGMAAAGVLIGAFNEVWPAFAVDALTFFVSMILVSRIATRSKVEGVESKANPRAIFAQLTDGMKIIVRSRALTGILVAAGVMMLGVGAVNVLMIPLIINELQVPVAWFGLVEFAQTSAMVISGSLVALLASRIKPTNILSMGLVVIGVTLGALSLVSNIWQLLAVIFVVGWAITPIQASIATLVQTSVEDSVRGRIGASLNTMISTASMASMALAGIFAEQIGVQNVFLLGGGLVVFAGLASALIFRVPTREAGGVELHTTGGEQTTGQMATS